MLVLHSIVRNTRSSLMHTEQTKRNAIYLERRVSLCRCHAVNPCNFLLPDVTSVHTLPISLSLFYFCHP